MMGPHTPGTEKCCNKNRTAQKGPEKKEKGATNKKEDIRKGDYSPAQSKGTTVVRSIKKTGRNAERRGTKV